MSSKKHTISNFRKFLLKLIKRSILLIMVYPALQANAQQLPISSHFHENRYLYNPSCIGMEPYTQAIFQVRKQWSGIQGAPETYHFTIDGSINKKKVGLGLRIFSDVAGILGRTGGYGTYRYRINFGSGNRLFMGLSVGFLQNKIHFDKIRAQNMNEPTLLKNSEKQTVFDANFGITYAYKNWKAGLSSYQLFNSKYYYEGNADIHSLNYKLIRHYMGTFEYEYQLNKAFLLEPQLILKNVQGMPLQFDFGTYINWRNKTWLGISYQHRHGVSISIGGLLYDQYTFSYSYDIPTGNIAGFTGGSHEFLIGLRIFRDKSEYQPDRIRQEELNHLKDLSQEQYEQIEKLEEEKKKLKRRVDSTTKDVNQQKQEIKKLKEIYNKDRQQINKTIEKYRISLKELESMDLSRESEDKRFYVVLGAYLDIKDAKFFQRILARETGLETKVVQRSDGKYFFVYSKKFKKGEEIHKNIRQEMKHLKRLRLDKYIDGNIWIYQEKEGL